MKNTMKVFGVIAIIAVIGFSMAACGGDDNGDKGPKVGVTVTVSIDKIDEKSFTITLDGANWNSSFKDGISGLNNTLFTEDTRQVTVTLNSYGTVMSGKQNVAYIFELINTGDTVGTFTLKEGYSNVSGTIKLNSGNTHGWGADMFSYMDVDTNKTNTLIINSAKSSITFDPFAGSWVGQVDHDSEMTLTAANGAFTVSVGEDEYKIDGYKGTYTVSGNTVSITFTQINTGALSGEEDEWISYDDALEAGAEDLPPKNIDGTISGNQFNIEEDEMELTFTKQE